MTQHNLNPNSPFFHEERHASLAPFADKPITICGAGALGGNLTTGFPKKSLVNPVIILSHVSLP